MTLAVIDGVLNHSFVLRYQALRQQARNGHTPCHEPDGAEQHSTHVVSGTTDVSLSPIT